MTRYWKIRAGRGGECWRTWKDESIITVGWDVGEVKKLSREETIKRIEDRYPDASPGHATSIIRKFRGITDESGSEPMRVGDITIVLGSGAVLGMAEIRKYEYHHEGIPNNPTHTYWRRVHYYKVGPVRIRDLPEKFQMYHEASVHLPGTMAEFNIKDEDFRELEEVMKAAKPTEIEKGLTEFSEDAVKQYMENNYHDLDESLMEIRREYHTRVGDADFVGKDNKGRVVVIEVKVGTAKDNAVGQLLGYMNAVRSEGKEDVRGILVAEDFTERVKEAVRLDDISLIGFRAKLDFINISQHS